MSHLNNSLDADFDSFLNVDNDYTSSAINTPHLAPHTLAQQGSSSSFGGNSQQQTWSGPSFQYDAYRQQTGLPVGGLANTFAVNENSGLNHFDGHSSFVMPNEISHFPLTKLEDFDFARHPSFDMADMDFEEESPADMPAMFFPGGGSKDFVRPTNLVSSNVTPTAPAPVQRMYPGMHSQQAAQKAQEAQQKQQELIREQQQQPPQQRQVPGQKSLPKGQPAKDPAVEESISRILSQMRQKRESSEADEESTPGPSTSLPRSKKEEDDMDDDERLLNSEEGKKLSSKERRQLRNKVSARAFRSRRKEYIGQLEGDIASKVDEANALRTENQQLREENNRLTDLTRMLLSSPAFSTFLQDLSQSGLPAAPASATPSTRQERPQTQSARKDVNPHDASRQMQQAHQQQQVGMVLMPETNIEASIFDPPAWNSVPSNNVSIFSVTTLPEEPMLDIEQLSGKTKPTKDVNKSRSKMLPPLPQIPQAVIEASEPATNRECQCQAPETVLLDSPCANELKLEPLALPTTSLYPSASLSIAEKERIVDIGSWEELQAACDELEEISDRMRDLIGGGT